MHTVYIHIDESLGENGMRLLQDELRSVNYITDVEVHGKTPHDLLVEFEEDHISPMIILKKLGEYGLHGYHVRINCLPCWRIA